MNFSLTIRILEIRLLLLLFRDVALYCMIRDSSMAINDWRIYPRLVPVIYLHRCTLTRGRRSQSCGHAQSCISVGLVWSFGTIIKSRMKVFDCRQQIKGIRRHCHHMRQRQTHLIFQSCLCHLCS